MPIKSNSRSVKMDIIRIFALYTVTGIHFFLFTKYLSHPINSPRMYIMTIMRTFFMICVPLFIMLSGYLMKNKKLNGRYYLGIIKTLGIYLLASVANYLYRILYLKENISVLSLGTGIFNFSIAPYAWYVEMYIGLFLLIPFLNLIYNNLESKNHKLALIATMIFMTSLPNVVNVWGFSTPGFFAMPSASNNYISLIPSWWNDFYPVTYYFIGCYLREYGLEISAKKNVFLIAASVLAGGIFNIYRSYPTTFVGGSWQTWGSIINVVNATLVFGLLLKINDSKIPAVLHKPLNVLSNLTFGAYLMSWIFDDFFYAKLNAVVTEVPMRLNWFPLMPLLTFVCAMAASFVLNLIYNAGYGIAVKLLSKNPDQKRGLL